MFILYCRQLINYTVHSLVEKMSDNVPVPNPKVPHQHILSFHLLNPRRLELSSGKSVYLVCMYV